MSNEKPTIICVAVDDGERVIPGSKQRECSQCGCAVWVNDTSFEAAGKDADLLCLSCATPYLADSENKLMKQIPSQIQQVIEAILGTEIKAQVQRQGPHARENCVFPLGCDACEPG